MASLMEDSDRVALPRWRRFNETLALGELHPASPPAAAVPFPPSPLARQLAAWREHRSLWHAADLLGAAIVVDDAEAARDAADFLLNNNARPDSLLANVARFVLDAQRQAPPLLDAAGSNHGRASMRALREALRERPRDAFRWTDLALEYTILGGDAHAKRAIRMALALAPENRFVLRSAARFYAHIGDPERAMHLLRSANSTEHDPWLMAAEIASASAAGRPIRRVRKAREMAESRSLDAFDISELASALGTIESEGGATRRAKKLLRRSLEKPTENSAAQALWIAEKRPNVISQSERKSVEHLNLPRLYEAKATEHFYAGEWRDAFEQAMLWFMDQPFSSRAANFASYIAASMLQEHEVAIQILLEARRSNPRDGLLLNNLAFSYALTNRIREATEALASIDAGSLRASNAPVVLATTGLVAFRSGEFELGRSFYAAAIEAAGKARERRTAAIAMMYLAFEELRAGSPLGHQWAERAQSAFLALPDTNPETREFLRRLRAIAPSARAPEPPVTDATTLHRPRD